MSCTNTFSFFPTAGLHVRSDAFPVFADMDLCNTVEHGCEHQCVSTPGSYYCICAEGQLLQEDGKSCGSKSSL